jgi:putative ATP-dependent endonuclease of OLD family
MEEKEYRDLLTIYPRQVAVHAKLKNLKNESQLYLSDDDLADLDTFAKRIRGEVLFARAWLLCEGQSEYLLIRYFAELLNTPLDNAGITVIDFQNNGSPGAFVGLARVFEIPWNMVCDNDSKGKQFISQIKNHGVTDKEISELVQVLPEENMDLELFLVKNGFIDEYKQILDERGIRLETNDGEEGFEDEIASEIRKHKTEFIVALIGRLRSAGANASRVPELFSKTIKEIFKRAL